VLYPYGAGTDAGATYAAPDLVTRPCGTIESLEGPPVVDQGGVAQATRPVGRS
jgi:hypothetical protein